MLDYLVDLVARIGHWGYAIVFAFAAAESAAFLGLLVPGESLVVLSGFLASQGVLDLDPLILSVALGAILGDNIGYELGRRLGAPWAAHHGRRFGLTLERLRRAEHFFWQHGGKSVFLGRFVGFARAVVPFLAGSARMRYGVFLVYNALGAALWGAAFTLLGYFLGQAAERIAGRASAIVGGTAFAMVAGALLWRWLVQHETEVRAAWARVRSHHRVAAALERIAPQIAWTKRRLTPGGYLGLQLTLGVVVFAGAAWLFGGIAEDVVHGDPLTVYDRHIAVWFSMHRNPDVTSFMEWVSRMHEWRPIATLAAILLLYLAWRRRLRWIIMVLCVLPGGMLLNVVLKLAFHRPRPVLAEIAATFSGYSFPSGHTVAATLLWGTLAAYLSGELGTWRARVLVVLVAILLIALVALSRLYLGAHYLSDVLAAAAEGTAWLALCHTAIETYWQSRMQRRAR